MKSLAGLPTVLLFFGLASLAASQAEEHADLPPTHSVQPEMYATGFAFAEGPALNLAGDLFVVNYRDYGTVGRITAAPDTAAGIFFDLREAESKFPEEHQPTANGLKIDSQQRLIVADSGAGRLLRIAADGQSVEVLADRWEGKRFNSVNDVALDLDGNIYFSDPGGSSVKNPIGSVYRYDIHTRTISRLKTGEIVETEQTDLAFPNGLAVSPDQQHLCLAESQKYRVLIFDLKEKGELTNRRVLIDFPTETRGNIIGGTTEPDGMIFDTAGRLYVAMFSGGVINVVDVPSGKLIRQYSAGGEGATNCHFHGDYLYITVAAKEAVFRLKLGVEGFDYAGTSSKE